MITALLLNADYSPLKTVNLQRTLSLLMNGKVDVVETVPDKVLRSPSVSIPMPSVLRLRYYRNVPRRRMVWSRRGVFARDNYTCVFCGQKLTREDATVDHLTPRETCARMGVRASTWSNTACSCPKCNRRKAARSLEDSGMHFKDPNFEPRIPRTNYLVVSGEIPEEWRVYLRT